MVILYSRGKNCESNHWRGTTEECHKEWTSGKLAISDHAAAKIEHDVAIHSSANRSPHISHIIIFKLAKAFAAGNVKCVWFVMKVLGILPITVLYFMRSS